MISSDALSCRLDHCPEEDENKEATLLPDSLFLNLLDLTLQDRIANAKDYNFDVTNAIAILLKEGPTGDTKQLRRLENRRKRQEENTILQREELCPKRLRSLTRYPQNVPRS